jgi:hypothetical protein
MQKSFIAIALALTLTSAFAAYTAQNYVTNPVVVAQDTETNFTNQTNTNTPKGSLNLASITPGNIFLYAGNLTENPANVSASNWNLFYRQLNSKTLLATSNNSASPLAPASVFFYNNYVVGFGVDTSSSGNSNLWAYQVPLTSGTTGPARLQLSNNTNSNFTVYPPLGVVMIGNAVYVAYLTGNITNSTNITSFTVGATTPGAPFTLTTALDAGSLSLTWGEALGSSQLFAVWSENGVLKDSVINVNSRTVGTPVVVPGYNGTAQACRGFATDKTLYGEFCFGGDAASGNILYWVRTTANGTLIQIANYSSNTSTFSAIAPYGPYLAVIFQSVDASNGTNFGYELWNVQTFNTTSVQPRRLYLTIDSNSTQVPFRVVSGGYYTLLFNNKQGNGTLTNVQVGLLLGSSYLASVLGFLLTIVAGLFLF